LGELPGKTGDTPAATSDAEDDGDAVSDVARLVSERMVEAGLTAEQQALVRDATREDAERLGAGLDQMRKSIGRAVVASAAQRRRRRWMISALTILGVTALGVATLYVLGYFDAGSILVPAIALIVAFTGLVMVAVPASLEIRRRQAYVARLSERYESLLATGSLEIYTTGINAVFGPTGSLPFPRVAPAL
jgi:hypothetical protein